MPRRYFHYLLVFLLLVAQQGALVHATWHALGTDERAAYALEAHDEGALQEGHEGRHGHDGHHDYDSEAPTGQGSLCAFDLAFGQVLGGAHGACALLLALAPATLPVVDVLYSRGSADAVPARSRGPPLVL